MRTFLSFVTVGLLTIAAPAVAQNKPVKSAAERATHRTEAMTRDLNLSAEQKVKVQAINSQFATQVDELRPSEAERAARQERRAKAQQARADYDAQLKAVLTAEQYATYQTQQQQRHDERKARHGRIHGQSLKRNKSLPAAQPEVK